MSAFNNRFNKDDIAERNAIAGILHKLHEAVSFEYVHDNKEVEEIKIPFYHSLTGDERLLMDEFLNEHDTSKAETQYDKVPRAIIYIDSSSIRSDALTNPHLRLKEVKEVYEEGDDEPTMKSFYTVFSSVPIQLNITCRIKVATHRDLLIISEVLKKNFFRNVRFQYDYRGLRVPGNLTFPDSIDRENPIEYTFDGIDRNQELLVSLEAETFLPSYVPGTSIFAGSRMANIENTVLSKNNLNK